MDIFSFVIIAAACLYTLRSAIMALGSWRERHTSRPPQSTNSLPLVSIIIPARNEEYRIARCLHSLARVDYPRQQLEIIIVNDRSTDRTGDVIRSWEPRIPNLHLVELQDTRKGNLRGKAGALDAGIRHSHGDIVLLTDADCAVHPQWVRWHVAQYADPVLGMVCAYTLIDGTRLFATYQAIEWLANHTLASAGVNFQQYLGCFGNNMSLRRNVYESIGGYGAIPFSVTEDLALLQAVGNAGWHVRYLCSIESSVQTEPCTTLHEYIQQHQRWVHGAKRLGWRAYLFVAIALVYWIGIVIALAAHSWTYLLLLIVVRILADGVLTVPVALRLRLYRLVWLIIPGHLALSILELCLPLFALSRTIRWKGQTFLTSEPSTGMVA